MLQTSTEEAEPVAAPTDARLLATASLAVESFTRLFAAAVEWLASPHGAERAETSDLAGQGSVDVSASVWLAEQGERLIAGFRDELAARAELFCTDAASASSAMSLASIEQVSYDATEVLVTLRALAQWLEMLAHEEFYLFNHRFGYLCGQFALPPARNPFSPSRVLEAFDAAGRRLAGYDETRLALLRQLRRAGLEGGVTVYSTLNEFLVDLGVLPRFRPRVARDADEEHARQRVIRTFAEERSGFRVTLRELAGQARRRLEDATSGAGVAAAPTGEGADSRDSAGGVARGPSQPPAAAHPERSAEGAVDAGIEPQAGSQPGGALVLPFAPGEERRTSARPDDARREGNHAAPGETARPPGVASRIGRFAAATLEVVNHAFGKALASRQLPAPVGLLLSRLQLVFFRAAVTDAAVLSQPGHPVRALVDRMSREGLAWSPELGESDPLFAAMMSTVERLQQPLATGDAEAFEAELRRFEQFLASEARLARQAAAERASRLHAAEQARIAQATAIAEIDRVLRDDVYPPLPALAERFVREAWVDVLREAYLREGKSGEQWQAALDFLHELSWSLKAKPSEAERRLLLRMLPALVGRVRAFAEGGGHDVGSFLSELMRAHLQLVRTGQLDPALRAPGESRPRLDFRQALEALDPALARGEIAPVLAIGTWVEIDQGGGLRPRRKLAWVSPLSGRALFTDRRGGAELVLGPDELRDALAEGKIIPLDAAPAFEQALQEARLRLVRLENEQPDGGKG